MSDIEPATDGDIAFLRNVDGLPLPFDVDAWHHMLIARIDAERASADDYQRRWHDERDASNALLDQREAERARGDALREALTELADTVASWHEGPPTDAELSAACAGAALAKQANS